MGTSLQSLIEAGEDLFEHYEELPQEVRTVLDSWSLSEGLSYENCKNLVRDLEVVGYTCEYGLDAEPYNLKKILNKLDNNAEDGCAQP